MAHSYRSVKKIALGNYGLFVEKVPFLDKAACYNNGIDPDAYFPPTERISKQNRMAKKVCLTCPVMAECLEYALVNNEPYGIWGGTTVKERNTIKKERRISAQASRAPVGVGLPTPYWGGIKASG